MRIGHESGKPPDRSMQIELETTARRLGWEQFNLSAKTGESHLDASNQVAGAGTVLAERRVRSRLRSLVLPVRLHSRACIVLRCLGKEAVIVR